MIQFSTFSFLTCECGHGLDAFGTHLAGCLFRGQRITTHDAIRDMMYALTTKMYGKSDGMPLRQEFHYEWVMRTMYLLSMWWLLTQHERQWL